MFLMALITIVMIYLFVLLFYYMFPHTYTVANALFRIEDSI